MKTIIKLIPLLIFFFLATFTNGQVQHKTKTTTEQAIKDENNKTLKANHNTTRSNRTTGSMAPDNLGSGSGESTSPSTVSKKGYDYYKAQSEMKSSQTKSKAQDYNSSRSNTTSIRIDKNDQSDKEKLTKKGIHDKVDKNEHARSKKKKNQ